MLGMLQDKQRILEGCCQLVPSLKHAQVVSDWAGLRPARDRVRLELESCQVVSCRVALFLVRPLLLSKPVSCSATRSPACCWVSSLCNQVWYNLSCLLYLTATILCTSLL